MTKSIQIRIMNIISFLVAIVILVIVLKLISLPFKLIMKFVINSIIGGVILFVLGLLGIGIIVRWWTIVLTGLFGVPGLIVAIIISII